MVYPGFVELVSHQSGTRSRIDYVLEKFNIFGGSAEVLANHIVENSLEWIFDEKEPSKVAKALHISEQAALNLMKVAKSDTSLMQRVSQLKMFSIVTPKAIADIYETLVISASNPRTPAKERLEILKFLEQQYGNLKPVKLQAEVNHNVRQLTIAYVGDVPGELKKAAVFDLPELTEGESSGA